ncbi:MAG: hypothetical protein KDK02_17755 [Rhodobacteraceae bacterium]|nr:hypothetical protein [Paracoccaceae bacterium]
MKLLYAMLRGSDSADKALMSEGWPVQIGAKIIAMPYNRKFVQTVYGGKTTGIDLNKPVGTHVELAMPVMNPRMRVMLEARIKALKTDWIKADDELQLFKDLFDRISRDLAPDRAAIAKLEKKIAETMKWSGATYRKCKPGDRECIRVLQISAAPAVPIFAIKDVLDLLTRMTVSLRKLRQKVAGKERDMQVKLVRTHIANATKKSDLIVKRIRSEIRAYNDLASVWPMPRPARL